jgi:hypothetical protein
MTAITRAKMEAATADYSELRAEIARHLGLSADEADELIDTGRLYGEISGSGKNERLRLRVRPADG